MLCMSSFIIHFFGVSRNKFDIFNIILRIRSIIVFFNDTATTEIYTLSLHDALPIFMVPTRLVRLKGFGLLGPWMALTTLDRKSTRLNSSHDQISYAVFCLKKKQ